MRRQANHCAGIIAVMVGLLILASAATAYSAGVTVVTHGYQSSSDFPVWTSGMSSAIRNRISGNYTLYRVTVTAPGIPVTLDDYVVDVDYSGGNHPDSTDSGEIVVELNWAECAGGGGFEASTEDIARILGKGFTNETFFPHLGHPVTELPVHFVGHSRGAVLLTQLAELLGRNGIWVNQLTTLDLQAAPIDNVLIGINLRENVPFADSYYHNDLDPTDLDGEPLDGAYSKLLDESALESAGYSKSHSDVHLWYHGTLDQTTPTSDGEISITESMRTTWWTSTEERGAKTGYYFSRILGGTFTGGTRLDSGLLSAHAHREPWDLDVSGAQVWDNVEISDFEGGATLNQGDLLEISALFLDFNRDASITLCFDDDTNPLNGFSGSYSSSKQTSSTEYNILDFYLDTTSLAPGTYFVAAKIANANHQRYYYPNGKLTVSVAGSPVLSNPQLSPGSGDTDDTYTYRVDYYDPAGSSPLEKKLYIDGVAYNMTLETGSSDNGTYKYAKSGLTTGAHNYRFSFKTGAGDTLLFPASGTHSGPTVSSTPDPNGRVKIDVYWGSDFPGENDEGGFVDPDITQDQEFSADEQHWFTAYPGFGWTVDKWRIRYIWSLSPGADYYYLPDAVSGNSAMMITRDVERDANNWAWNAVYCTFKRLHADQRILTISKIGPGSVNPAVGEYEYPLAGEVPVTAAPVGDAQFLKWMLDGVQVSTALSYTVSMESQDHSIQAVFQYSQTAIYTNELPCIADASIRMEDFGESGDHYGYGSESCMGFKVSTPRNYTWDTAFKFDLSPVPVDATIQQVYLRLFCTGLPNRDGIGYEVQKNTNAWDEDTIQSAQPTCINPFNYNGNGLFNGGEQAYHDLNVSGRIPDAVNWISEWRTDNYGLRVRPCQYHVADEYSYEGYYDFATRHVGDSSHWPVLRVVYEGQRLVPVISTDVTNLNTTVVRGEAASNLYVNVWNSGEGTLNYASTTDVAWIALGGQYSGSSTGETHQMSIGLNPSLLPLGSHLGQITVSDNNASNEPLLVTMSLEVRGPWIGHEPTNMTATTEIGLDAESSAISVWNIGYGELTFSLSNTTSWLNLSTNFGQSTGDVEQVVVEYRSSSLSPGTYSDTIVIMDQNGDADAKEIPVDVTVLDRVAQPILSPPDGGSGQYEIYVTMTCTTADAEIRYTVDGTEPGASSTLYGGSGLSLSNTTLVRAKAWLTGMLPSTEISGLYTIVDSDRDGIDDDWEVSHFFKVSEVGETSDFDGDGFIDLFEFKAGTDPADAQSCLAIRELGLGAGSDVSVRWSSISGKLYRVMRATNLLDGFLPVATNVEATSVMSSFTDTNASFSGGVFYRLELEE